MDTCEKCGAEVILVELIIDRRAEIPGRIPLDVASKQIRIVRYGGGDRAKQVDTYTEHFAVCPGSG